MRHPVELSEELLAEARLMSNQSDRSLEEQVEFWADLGRIVDSMLQKDSNGASSGRTLSEAIRQASTEDGRERVRDYRNALPFPRFQPVAGSTELVLKVEEDGTETLGRFVDRVFHPVEP